MAAAAVRAADSGQELIEPDQAFRVEARMQDAETLAVTWRIAEDHYMYQRAFSVRAPDGGVTLGEPVFPKGKTKHDEFFGEVVVYESDVTFTVRLTPIADGFGRVTIEAVGQGCNEPVGVCFPPQTRTLAVALDAGAADAPQSLMRPVPGDGSGGLDALLGSSAVDGGGQRRFLHPDEAFRFELSAMAGDALLARFDIEPGYYLYRDEFSITSDDPGVEVSGVRMPQGKSKTDEYFGETRVFYDGFDARVDLQRRSPEARSVRFTLTYQGCAEGGICYPPIEKTATLSVPAAGDAPAANGGSASDGLQAGYWPLLLALGAGVLLTFTPCVLPMVPILAGIIVGQGRNVTRRRGGGLAAVYVLGTAVTYTAVGVVAGLTGDQLQAWFQNAWAIGFLALLVLLMALSMFGFYDLAMPAGLQSRLQHRAAGLKAGAFGGVFLMGVVSALVVGACVSPVLISILGLAINRGDPVLGGLIMFVMALGMGVFLVAMGFGFGHVLPRAGPWMERIKHLFGVLLLAVAVYLLGAIPEVPVLYLWAGLLLGVAVYMGVHGIGGETLAWKLARQVGAVVLVAWSVLAVLGGLQGNRDILEPFDYGALHGPSRPQTVVHAKFEQVDGGQELARLMAAAREQGKPVMVDYYADWCVDCVRMENTTFADPKVAQVLNRRFTLLQIDVTDPDDPGTRAIKKQHGVYGPPAMLFFNRSGEEVRDMRRYGYMDSEAFLAHIDPLRKD